MENYFNLFFFFFSFASLLIPFCRHSPSVFFFFFFVRSDNESSWNFHLNTFLGFAYVYRLNWVEGTTREHQNGSLNGKSFCSLKVCNVFCVFRQSRSLNIYHFITMKNWNESVAAYYFLCWLLCRRCEYWTRCACRIHPLSVRLLSMSVDLSSCS